MRTLHEPIVPVLLAAGAVILSAAIAAAQPAAADTKPPLQVLALELTLVEAPRSPDPVLPMPPAGIPVSGVWGRYGFVLDGEWIPTGLVSDEARRVLRRSNDPHVAERTQLLTMDRARSEVPAALRYWGSSRRGAGIAPRARVAVTPQVLASDQMRLKVEVVVYARQGDRGSSSVPPRAWAEASTIVVFKAEQTVAFETVENLFVIVTPHVIKDESDVRRTFDRAVREREEDLDHALLFLHPDWLAPLHVGRTSRGLLGEIRLAQESDYPGPR
jgi:hypothetical protein